jgi:hypothetical protein
LFSRRLCLTLVWTVLAACEFPAYRVDVADDAGSAGAGGAKEPTPDACAAAPCLHEGKCIPVGSSFVCLCEPGFRGDDCEINFDDCVPDPCQNGGTCIDGNDSSRCECVDGWDGATCQHDVDDCAPNPCKNSGTCVDAFKSYSCNCQPGFIGADCTGSLPPTCDALHAADPTALSGVYSVDPDGPGQGNPPLEVLCDMTSMDGGWTMVGQERQGDTGTFKFLGVSVGDPSLAARDGTSVLVGEQFAGAYDELRIGWFSRDKGNGAVYFRINEEVFANNVRKSMPISGFATTDATLLGWMNDAGGAVFCRGSESPGVRPGDSSWAIKPKDVAPGNCGCSGAGWSGKGVFYGGHPNATFCNSSGGGWSGVVDDGEAKGNVDSWGLQLWIR